MASVDLRILRRARQIRVTLAFGILLGVLAGLLVLAQAVLIGWIVAAAFEGARLRLLTPALALLLAVFGGRAASGWGFEVVTRLAAARLMSQLRSDIARARLQLRSTTRERTAEIATLAVEGTAALEALLTEYLPQLVLAVVIPLAVLSLVARLDLLSAALMLLTLPVALLFMWLLGHAAAERNRERWQALVVLAAHFSDVVRGLPTLRAFNRGRIQVDRISEVSDAYRRATMETLRISFLSGAVLDMASTLGVALIAVTMGVRLVAGNIGFAPALIVLLLTPELYLPLRNLGARYHASAQGRSVAGRLLDLAETFPLARNLTVSGAAATAFRFEDVWYTYPTREGAVLQGLDFSVERGETVALVGESGAGKTTLAALLLLLCRPCRGRLLAGELDLDEADPATWRAQVAWLPQHPTLFRASVASNVRLGRPDADVDHVRAVCVSLGADDFISRLPAGYETVVGDGGRPLSAGERQKIALARAFLRDAPLLILDEPTAHLDEEAAQEVLSVLASRRGTQTILLITHREDVASAADRVVRMQEGRIALIEPYTPVAKSA